MKSRIRRAIFQQADQVAAEDLDFEETEFEMGPDYTSPLDIPVDACCWAPSHKRCESLETNDPICR